MPALIDPAELIDAHEVARLLRLSRPNSVSVYLHRYRDFPRPVVDSGRSNARHWLRGEILAWASVRGRPGPDPVPEEGSLQVRELPAHREPPAGRAAPLSSATLVGRDREMADVAEAMSSGRIVVVTGPSGVGKTSLMRELGGRTGGSYEDGAA
ncbi:MAG: AAA family ATPase, partial [Candidatus Dormibacteria bacterium]